MDGVDRRAPISSRKRARLTTVAAEVALLSGLGATLAISLNARAAAPESAGSRAAVGAPIELEIAATGDVTLGRAGLHPAGGPQQLLAHVARDLRAAVSLGNLETTLVDTGRRELTRPSVEQRRRTASPSLLLKVSPEDCGTSASRSSISRTTTRTTSARRGGRARSRHCRRAGLRQTGSPGQITQLRVRGVRGRRARVRAVPRASNLLDLNDARTARASSAARRADVVLVTMHIGAEGTDRMRVPSGPETYLGEARGDSRAFGHAVVDAGADLVVGHGPHVVRGIEWYRGRLIAHSLGNLSGHQTVVTGRRPRLRRDPEGQPCRER